MSGWTRRGVTGVRITTSCEEHATSAWVQAAKLLPEQLRNGDAEAESESRKVLAVRLGQFLRICPGLNKHTIGELLGDPDPFYLQVREWRHTRAALGRLACKSGHPRCDSLTALHHTEANARSIHTLEWRRARLTDMLE